MYAYITVDQLKRSSWMDIEGDTDDDRLEAVIRAASRDIDGYTKRHFQEIAETRKFDGDGSIELLLSPNDLISIDTDGLKTDDNQDRTFETTWATTDYLLFPANANPTGGLASSRPYRKVIVDTVAGSEDVFTSGRETVQIAGKWGWWRKLTRATETMNQITDAAATSVVVNDRTDIEAGHTLLLDSEQMYVKSYSGNTLTVERGANGTTGATHDDAKVIDIYEYPPEIVEATVMRVLRQWARRQSAFALSVGNAQGSFQSFRGRDPDLMNLIAPYKRM